MSCSDTLKDYFYSQNKRIMDIMDAKRIMDIDEFIANFSYDENNVISDDDVKITFDDDEINTANTANDSPTNDDNDEINATNSTNTANNDSLDNSADTSIIMNGSNRSNRSSILTFNASVSNKKVIKDMEKVPYQIMASTRNYLTSAAVLNYPETYNPNLLLHMNYITRPFNDNAIETNSRERASLRQYAKLAKRTGTKDILIHMPSNLTEYMNMAQGLRVIGDELIKQDLICHLEIEPWTLELQSHLKLKDNPQVISEFIDRIISRFSKFPKGSFSIVLDTAHLFALGCDADEQIKLFHKYRSLMKYCHLNGDINPKYSSDSHVPIMSSKNKMTDWVKLSAEIAKLGLICVAEITKYGKQWNEWEDYAKRFNFDLIPYHKQLCY